MNQYQKGTKAIRGGKMSDFLNGCLLYIVGNGVEPYGRVLNLTEDVSGIISIETDEGEFFFFSQPVYVDGVLYFFGHRYPNGNVPRYAIITSGEEE